MIAYVMLLTMSEPEIQAENTQALRKSKLYARSNGSWEEAILSAGYYAKKMGKTMFVYRGNSYGHSIWFVSYKRGDYLNAVNNTGPVVFSVTPDLTMSVHQVIRTTANPRKRR